MRRTNDILWICMIVAVLAAGCARRADQAAETSTDSLLASSPAEPTAGDITPQTEFQPEPQGSTPTPAPAPRASAPRDPAPRPEPQRPQVARDPGVTVPAGTPIKIAVDGEISSETAQPGDTWTGTVKEPVVLGTAAPIPAGSTVSGVITGTRPAEKGSRAFLVLAVTSITVDGRTHRVAAGTDSIIAGSTRARNLGAIAGGAAAGALIGKAVGGSGKGALIGGILGGAAATGAVSATKGYQVVIKPGTEITFNVDDAVVMRQ